MNPSNNIQGTKFNISDVISNEAIMNSYIQELNKYIKNKTSLEMINYARSICSGLPSEEELTQLKTLKNTNDKGLYGKILEYGVFGQKPNSDSNPDLVHLGYDIKSCAFKTLSNSGKNAKERQTITNCGDTKNYDSFKNICENEEFSKCNYYAKSKTFILFVRKDDKIIYKTFDQLLNQSMLTIVLFDIEKIPEEMINTIKADYSSIRKSIIEKKVSQKEQRYLHIHPHGAGHGSGTRALGFTPRFITMVVALQFSKIYKKNIEDIIIIKGKSVAVRKEYL